MSGVLDAHRRLTNAALADRLRRIIDKPRTWSAAEKESFVTLAAERLEVLRGGRK